MQLQFSSQQPNQPFQILKKCNFCASEWKKPLQTKHLTFTFTMRPHTQFSNWLVSTTGCVVRFLMVPTQREQRKRTRCEHVSPKGQKFHSNHSRFLVANCCCKERLYKFVTLWCRLSVHPVVQSRSPHPHPLSLETWFLASSANLSNLFCFVFQKKNSPKFFFHLQKFFPTFIFIHFWMFHAILSAQKNFHPKLFFT